MWDDNNVHFTTKTRSHVGDPLAASMVQSKKKPQSPKDKYSTLQAVWRNAKQCAHNSLGVVVKMRTHARVLCTGTPGGGAPDSAGVAKLMDQDSESASTNWIRLRHQPKRPGSTQKKEVPPGSHLWKRWRPRPNAFLERPQHLSKRVSISVTNRRCKAEHPTSESMKQIRIR